MLCSDGDMILLLPIKSALKSSAGKGNLKMVLFVLLLILDRLLPAAPLLLVLSKNLLLATCFSNTAIFLSTFLRMFYLAKMTN